MNKVNKYSIILYLLLGACSPQQEYTSNYDDFLKTVEVIKSDIPESMKLNAAHQLDSLAKTGELHSMAYIGCEVIKKRNVYFEIDWETAIEYLKKAKNGGVEEPINCLAEYYYDHGEIESYVKILKEGLRLEYTESFAELGFFYVYGFSSKYHSFEGNKYPNYRNVKDGEQYLLLSSDLGDISATLYLAKIYLRGSSGIAIDSLKAKQLLFRIKGEDFSRSDEVLELLNSF